MKKILAFFLFIILLVIAIYILLFNESFSPKTEIKKLDGTSWYDRTETILHKKNILSFWLKDTELVGTDSKEIFIVKKITPINKKIALHNILCICAHIFMHLLKGMNTGEPKFGKKFEYKIYA